MKCIVTGASGHIGNVLVRQLLKNGYKVTAFVKTGEKVDFLEELNIAIQYGDVQDKESLKRAYIGQDIVFI